MKVGILGRGLTAGLAAAIAVAIWFLLIDASQGVPFRTPALLSGGLLGVDPAEVGAGLIFGYTVVHFLAFVAAGVGTAWLVSKMPVSPGAVLGLVLGFLLFDLMFYGSVLVTGVDVVNELGWPEVLAGNLIAGVVLMKVLHATGTSKPAQWLHVLDDHATTREGLYAGLIGAVAVAVWFLAFDIVQERPFFTPGALGSALFLGAGGVNEIVVSAQTVLGYSAVHLTAFLVAGLLAAWLLRQAEDNPPILLAGLVAFVAFEALFLGLLAIVAQFLLGPLAWWSIVGGNLIATVCMGLFLWRRHPGLVHELDSAHLFDRDDTSDDSPTRKAAQAGRR